VCASCGTSYQPGDRACSSCGALRSDGEQAVVGAWSPSSTAMVAGAKNDGRGCPDCGTPFQPGDRACGRCGRSRASGDDTVVTAAKTTGPQPLASLRRPLLPGPAAPVASESTAAPSALTVPVAPTEDQPNDGEPAWESMGPAVSNGTGGDGGRSDDRHAGAPSLDADGISIVSGHRFFVAALVAIIAALLVGGLVLVSRRRPVEATEWRFGQRTPLPSGIHQRPTLRWRAGLATAGSFSVVRGGVLQDDTHVYAAYQSGSETFVSALDRKTGAVVWADNAVGPYPFLQLIAGRLVVSQSGGGKDRQAPFALDPLTGQRVWTLNGQGAFAFNDSGPLLVVRGSSLVVVDPVTGADRWSTSMDVDYVPAAGVFIRRQCDTVSASDWSTGSELWTAKLQNDPCSAARTPPAVAVGADVVVYADGQELVGVDRLTGVELWRGPSPAPVDSLEALGENLVLGRRNDDAEVFAVNVHTGDAVFDGSTPQGRMISLRAGNRDTLLVANDRGLQLLDPVTFAPIGDPRPVDAYRPTAKYMLAADTTYKLALSLGSRTLTAYDLSTGAARWSLELSDGNELVSVGRLLIVADERGLAAYS
jgi:outer membrane protein assembly factor BamB